MESSQDDNAVQPSSTPAVRLLAQHAMRGSGTPSEPQSAPADHGTRREHVRVRAQHSPASTPCPFYTSTQWTADGTSLIATTSAQAVSSFVLPADLLQPAGAPRMLQPQATLRLPEPTQVVAAAPYFSLADPASQLLLVGCRDHPLQIYHAFPSSDSNHADELANDGSDDRDDGAHAAPLTSYKLIRKESEQYITPASLLWEHPGTHFVCGSANRVDYFDVSRPGSDGPLLTIPTIPSRRHISKGHGVGMKGTVAALSASPPEGSHDPSAGSAGSGIFAAGTWTRWMGLYDLRRTDRVVANWSVANAAAEVFRVALGGQGIAQTAWSPCGRYLVINERHASGLLVYDIRVTGQLLAVLAGRTAPTQQRLRCDVFPGGTGTAAPGFEVWAGCHDGRAAVWEAVGARNDVLDPSWVWPAHDAPVASAAVHPSGSVVATCSGGWGHLTPEQVGEGAAARSPAALSEARVFDESSIKVWALG
ncbi:Guanine nucleotide-binding protein negative regulator 1 [Escovopsis weberi]|uniref:Guanine nucleotide-binding protein negative regulator 1 n=1 Tax=Escovopsis weberi TaxID=150374 RepID=A0A0M9VXJ4_ESCWE|nr:Guanine nucleotide-binding protein negative regulator 1 [Escovopsis weberi]